MKMLKDGCTFLNLVAYLNYFLILSMRESNIKIHLGIRLSDYIMVCFGFCRLHSPMSRLEIKIIFFIYDTKDIIAIALSHYIKDGDITYEQNKMMLSHIKLSRYLDFLCRFQWEIFLVGIIFSASIPMKSIICYTIVPPVCRCLRSLSFFLYTHVSIKPQTTSSNATLL